VVVGIGALVAIIGVVISAFAGGGGGTPSAGAGAAAGGTTPSVAAGPVDPSARTSCASFDLATSRLAARDTKAFIDDMTDAANDARAAAGRDSQWQLLVGQFAAFATDLSANDATSLYNDLDAINEQCAAVRGERPLVLNTRPVPGSTTTTTTTTTPPAPTTPPPAGTGTP
jgi:hypothetical protein